MSKTPWSLEAEMALLGSCYIAGKVMDECSLSIRPEHFFRPAHQEIYRAMLALKSKGQSVDLVTLVHELGARLEEVGGENYLIQIGEYVPSVHNAEHYASVVLEKAELREAISKAEQIITAAETEDLASVRTLRTSISDHSVEVFGDCLTEWSQIDVSKPQRGISTGHPALDKATGVGWVASQNNVVSAQTKGGKTSFMVGCVRHAVLEGYRVVYALFADLDDTQLKRRTLKADCGVGGVPSSLAKNAVYEEAMQSHDDPFGKWANLKVYDARKHGRTVETFVAKMVAARKKFAYDIVFCDYAQKLSSSAFGPSEKTNCLEYASEYIEEHLARRFEIPVVIGSQVTKGVDGQFVTKYARALEEDAGFVVRTVVDDEVRVEVPLNRFGPKGLVFDADWDEQRVQFRNLRLRGKK